jgi:hypothetical protein
LFKQKRGANQLGPSRNVQAKVSINFGGAAGASHEFNQPLRKVSPRKRLAVHLYASDSAADPASVGRTALGCPVITPHALRTTV